jgi:hypothetical protein
MRCGIDGYEKYERLVIPSTVEGAPVAASLSEARASLAERRLQLTSDFARDDDVVMLADTDPLILE